MRATCYKSRGLRLTRFICLTITLFLLFFAFLYILFCSLQTFTGGLRTGIEVYRPVKVVQTYKASVKGDLGTAAIVRGRPLS